MPMLECSLFLYSWSEKVKQLAPIVLNFYQKIRNYFADGSFTLAVYPFLMLPCVRFSYQTLLRLLAVWSVFCGLYYFFAELSTALFSSATLGAYVKHTTIELLLPLHAGEQNLLASPLAQVMHVAYWLQSISFAFFYFIGVGALRDQHWRWVGGGTAILFCIGIGMILSAQGGNYTVGGLHNIGFELTFLCGNITMLATGCAITSKHYHRFKWYSLLAGLAGGICVITPLFWVSEFTPLLERLGIYALLIWEIALGFSVLKSINRSL